MDALAGLLEGPRARGAFLLRAIMSPPWSLLVQDEAPITIINSIGGDAWVVQGDRRVELRAGDVVVMRGPDPYVIADRPDTAPLVVVNPGQRCSTPDGAPLSMDLGVRTWGNDPNGTTELLIGAYQLRGEITQRLLDALPSMVLAPGWDSPLMTLLRDEIGKDEPGQEVVLDRLLDLLLIAVLRAWFSRPEGVAPGWYLAMSDPVVGPALRLLHDAPAQEWTVASLASGVGVSRAGLARRFTDLVGEPPMAYLTGWRLDLAADLLREPAATVGSVARKVGYGSAFALSTAFKRVRGVSPRQHRAAEG